jgi:hypothetical protein
MQSGTSSSNSHVLAGPQPTPGVGGSSLELMAGFPHSTNSEALLADDGESRFTWCAQDVTESNVKACQNYPSSTLGGLLEGDFGRRFEGDGVIAYRRASE